MKFESISSLISTSDADKAQKTLSALFLELGIAEYNCHVGSGIGGNNFQLLAMMQMNHHLVVSLSRKKPIIITDRGVWWDVKSVNMLTLKKLRKELDSQIKDVPAAVRYTSVALYSNINNPDGLIESLKLSKDAHFGLKTVDEILATENDLINQSYSAQIIMACLLCAELVKDLSSKKLERISSIGKILSTVDMEVFLLSVRKIIGINRIIDFNLDEHPIWKNIFTRISKAVDQ